MGADGPRLTGYPTWIVGLRFGPSSPIFALIATTTPAPDVRRPVPRVAPPQTHVIAVVPATGELACRQRRAFAGGLTSTDPAHQTELKRLHVGRRLRHEVDVEICRSPDMTR